MGQRSSRDSVALLERQGEQTGTRTAQPVVLHSPLRPALESALRGWTSFPEITLNQEQLPLAQATKRDTTTEVSACMKHIFLGSGQIEGRANLATAL
jgi:hypothetical protein